MTPDERSINVPPVPGPDARMQLERLADVVRMDPTALQQAVLGERRQLASTVSEMWRNNRDNLQQAFPNLRSEQDLEQWLTSLESHLRLSVEAAEQKSTFMSLVTAESGPLRWALDGTKKVLGWGADAAQFAWRHKYKIAAGLALGAVALYFGAPYVFNGVADIEAWGTGAGLDWFRRFNDTMAPLSPGLGADGSLGEALDAYNAPPGSM